MFSSRLSTLRPLATAEAGDAMHLTWMLKSFIMGITLLGLSYWLVQIAGIQYFASLTSGTLLFFLLAYVVWCLLHRNRHSRQVQSYTTSARLVVLYVWLREER
jgi:energy-coupling factor transporter transmembrane protein EcfT